jgi:hypothetical protein
MAKEPTFNFGANRRKKPAKAKPKKPGGKSNAWRSYTGKR